MINTLLEEGEQSEQFGAFESKVRSTISPYLIQILSKSFCYCSFRNLEFNHEKISDFQPIH